MFSEAPAFDQDIDSWDDKEYFIYDRDLQAEDTVQLGFLFGSTNNTDCASLTAYFRAKYELELGFRWRRCSKGGMSLSKEHKVPHAVHVECAADAAER